MSNLDLSLPIEIALEVFWVGVYLPDDPLQCHTYLIRHPNGCVLVDPGSLLTFEETKRKIGLIADWNDIKYIICHHQDPDLASCLPELEERLPHPEKCFIITHTQTALLLKHYNLKIPFYLVDEHQFRLQLDKNRSLIFILTPYMHHPANIVTYDPFTKVLFSSDIFGGYMDPQKWSLFAKDESYFEAIREFHEVYLAHRSIVLAGLAQIDKYPIEIIAPQHGSIIKKKYLIKKAFEALENFEYGQMLKGISCDFKSLTLKIEILSKIRETILKNAFLSKVLLDIQEILKDFLPLKAIHLCIKYQNESFWYKPENNFRPKKVKRCPEVKGLWYKCSQKDLELTFEFEEGYKPTIQDKEFLHEVFDLIKEVAEREKILLSLQKRHQKLKNKAYYDALTGLFNRQIIQEILPKEIARAQRHRYPVSVIMFDIDNFKQLNDTYGHLFGDKVLKTIAQVIQNSLRKGDFCIRYGGEEILVFLPHTDHQTAYQIAERIRQKINTLKINGVRITVSAGISSNQNNYNLEEIISKADKALYKAKSSGKNQVAMA